MEVMTMPAPPIPSVSASGGPRHSNGEFERLITPILGRAYQTALYLTRDPVEAEEVVQDAAVSALRGFSGFSPGTNFRAWFLKIVTNAFYQRCRSAARVPETVSLNEDGSPQFLLDSHVALDPKADDPSEHFMQQLTDQQVRGAIADLPDSLRVVATLYFLYDLRYKDIAQIVQCPVGTVRSRLHRARAALKATLWLQVVDPDSRHDGVERACIAASA